MAHNADSLTAGEGGGRDKRTHKPERGKATAYTCGKRLLSESCRSGSMKVNSKNMERLQANPR